MQSHNPISPHSPWRPLAASQQAARPLSSFERAHRFQADMERRQARDRRAALAAAVEYTTACIVEYYPEESSSSSGGSNGNKKSKNSKDRRPSFLGWFPPTDASNFANPPDECLQFRLGMDLDTSRVKRFGTGDDGYYDEDEDDEDEDEDDDGWDDCDIDDDLDNIKCPAPLLWLRFSLSVIPPAGAPASSSSSRSQAATATAADMEAVHLVMPAHVFLPKRLGASAASASAANKPPPTTAPPPSSSTKPSTPLAPAPSVAPSPIGAPATRNHHLNNSSASTSSSPPDGGPDDDPPTTTAHGPSITLTRYTTAHLRSPNRSWQPPAYVGAAAHAAGINLHSLCYIDVVLHPSRRSGPLAFVAARWMRLASGVENALCGDVRAVGAAKKVRVHCVWTRDLAEAVGEVARVLGIDGGGEGVVGAMERGVEGMRLRRARRLVMGRGEGVAVGGWGNFVEWTEGVVGGGDPGSRGGGMRLSSSVERLGLVEGGSEGYESEDEDESEGGRMVVEKNRKKRKVGHGEGKGDAVLTEVKGRKISKKGKGGRA